MNKRNVGRRNQGFNLDVKYRVGHRTSDLETGGAGRNNYEQDAGFIKLLWADQMGIDGSSWCYWSTV